MWPTFIALAIFIGAAFIVASILSTARDPNGTLVEWAAFLLLVFFFLALLVTVLWQLCETLFAQKRFIWLGVAMFANYAIAISAINQSYLFLKGLVS